MSLFSQTKFPTLWRIAQRFVGGSKDKQSLSLRFWKGQSKILEIGCSVGNITNAFARLEGVEYTGIDVDPVAIAAAKKYFFNNSRVRFVCMDVEEYANEGNVFDYIVVAGMLHHIDDLSALSVLKSTRKLASEKASIIVYDPELLRKEDSIFFKAVYKLEQGQYLRSNEELIQLIHEAGMEIVDSQLVSVRPGLPLMPAVARFSLIVARWPACHSKA